MNKISITCIFLLLFLVSKIYTQEYGWTNIGSRLPNTISTATISDIAVIGDSIWITSGYGTYLNKTPGEIYFSTDGGTSFSIQSTKYGTHAICMLDSKNGWCGGVEGQIYSTSNGGETWERRFSFGKTLMDIDFPPNSDTGFCVGFTGGVKKLTPTNLLTINMSGYVSNIYNVSCPDKRHAFVAGEEIIGPIIDGELQIDQSYPGTNGIYGIEMIDSLYGWCVGSPTAAGAWDSSGCMIIHTTDGHEWLEQTNPVKGKTGTLMAIKALNKLEAWAVGTSGVVLHTIDGGTNWVREAEGLTNEMLYGISVVNNKEIYVTGNNKTLLKYGLVSGIKNYDVNTNIKDIEIFPIPTNDIINIKLNTNEQIQSINIIDFNGKLLLNQTYISKPEISLAHLPNGVFFIEIITDKNIYQQKIVKRQ